MLFSLVEPLASLPEADRRRARLLSGLLLSLILLIVLAFISSSLITPAQSPFQNPALPVAVGAVLLLALTYSLNRAGRYLPAAVLTALIAALGAWASIIANRALLKAEPFLIAFVVVSVLLASILLSPRATALLAVAHLLGLYLLFPGFVIGLIFIGFMSGLILVSATISRYDLAQINRQTRELADREEHFRALIENSADNISLVDVNGTLLYESPSARRLLGYAPNEFVGRNALELVHPDDLSPIQDMLAHLIHQPGLGLSAQFRLRHRDGLWIWVEAVATNLLDKPSVQAIVINYRDITDRWQAEVALRQSEEQYRHLFESNPHPMWVYDLETLAFLAVNEAACQHYGYTREEFLAITIRDIRPPEDLPLLGENLVQPSPELEKAGSWRHRKKDGTLIDVEITSHAFTFVGRRARLVLANDITERKRAEEALKVSEEKFRAVVDTAADAIISANTQGNIIYLNTGAERVFGYVADEVLGRPLTLLMPERFQTAHRQGLERYLKTGEAHVIGRIVELTGKRKDSTEFPFEFSLASWNAGGETFFTGILRDITERKYAEEQIRRNAAHAEALARVAARLNAQLDLETVLTAVCEEIARALNAPATAVRLYQPNQDSLYYAQAYGLPPDYRKYTRPSPRALFDDLIRQQGPLIVALDVLALSPVPNAEFYAAMNIRTVVTAAMIREGQLIGGLNVFSVGETRHFTEDELALLKSLADQASQAIVNARLYEENIRKLDALVALYATAQQLTQSRDLHELARETVRSCVEAFGARLAWLGRAEPDGRITVLETYGQGTEVPQRLAFRWDETPEAQGAVGTAIRSGFPVVISDLAGDPRAALWREAAVPEGFRSMVALPLISRARPFGVLVLLSDQLDAFPGEQVDFLKSYANQAAAALENARLFAETQRRLSRTQALRDIDLAITGSLELRVTLSILLDQVASQLNVDAADVLIFHAPAQMLEYAAGRGFRTDAIQGTRRRLGEGNAGRAALERRVVHIPHLPSAGSAFTRTGLLSKESFVAYYGVPLIAKGQVKGVLEIFHRAPLDADPEWLAFMEALAGQAAIAIDNATLFDDLQRSNTELALAYETTLEGWSAALDLRDKETEGHTRRVTEMMLKLARRMGFKEDELVQVRRGALLHDIGKMGVPDAILLKPGKLTDEEWVIMRRHPTYAYELLSPIAYLRPALDIPYCHHEKWDGTGYPRGLKGEQIPLAARLFSVIDVWDALRSDRPYRQGWPEEKVRSYLREQAGMHFDAKVVKAFLEMDNLSESG